jgi:hypothetical protein
MIGRGEKQCLGTQLQLSYFLGDSWFAEERTYKRENKTEPMTTIMAADTINKSIAKTKGERSWTSLQDLTTQGKSSSTWHS